jgi:hypothetical protein
MATRAQFMEIIPRHRRALEFLAALALQPGRDPLGCIGVAALRDEDEPFTLEQIVNPLFDRGLIEDLTATELGRGGKYFVRITKLGAFCLGLGIMLRDARKSSELEIKKLLQPPAEMPEPPTVDMRVRILDNPHDPNDEHEAIA